jgi:hypothetical protein
VSKPHVTPAVTVTLKHECSKCGHEDVVTLAMAHMIAPVKPKPDSRLVSLDDVNGMRANRPSLVTP